MCNSYPIVMSELEKCRNCVDQKKLTDSQCHNLYGFVIDLTGTTGNEKKNESQIQKSWHGVGHMFQWRGTSSLGTQCVYYIQLKDEMRSLILDRISL